MEEIKDMLENTRLRYDNLDGYSFDYSFINGGVRVSMYENIESFASLEKTCVCEKSEIERVIEELKNWKCYRNKNKLK